MCALCLCVYPRGPKGSRVVFQLSFLDCSGRSWKQTCLPPAEGEREAREGSRTCGHLVHANRLSFSELTLQQEPLSNTEDNTMDARGH